MDSHHVSVDKAMDILKIDIEKREQLKKSYKNSPQTQRRQIK